MKRSKQQAEKLEEIWIHRSGLHNITNTTTRPNRWRRSTSARGLPCKAAYSLCQKRRNGSFFNFSNNHTSTLQPGKGSVTKQQYLVESYRNDKNDNRDDRNDRRIEVLVRNLEKLFNNLTFGNVCPLNETTHWTRITRNSLCRSRSRRKFTREKNREQLGTGPDHRSATPTRNRSIKDVIFASL